MAPIFVTFNGHTTNRADFGGYVRRQLDGKPCVPLDAYADAMGHLLLRQCGDADSTASFKEAHARVRHVMGLGDKVGRLAVGMEADVIALDLRATPALKARAERAEDPWHGLFGAMILGDERCVQAVWSGGRRLR